MSLNASHRPYSEACERNKEPILEVLQQYFAEPGLILEIGSGTGQHAVYFARQLPHLRWQPSDRAENLPGIGQWLIAEALPNVNATLELDVTRQPWPIEHADGAFSANTAHIMAWPMVEYFFAGVGRVLRADGYFCLYGPFNYQGRFTSPSNARFDASLRARDPAMGIRDFEALDELARQAELVFVADHEMPANNRLLVWRKTASATQDTST